MTNKDNRLVKAKTAIRKAKVNRDKARKKILAQRKQLAERREENRKRSDQRKHDKSTDSNNNPVIFSMLPQQQTNKRNAMRNSHSTVPEKPKYSEVEAKPRLYGHRFYQERNSGGESDE